MMARERREKVETSEHWYTKVIGIELVPLAILDMHMK